MRGELIDGLLLLLVFVGLVVWAFSPVWQAWLHRRIEQKEREREPEED